MSKGCIERNTCVPCKKNSRKIVSKKRWGIFGGILLALLPKCPFCFMAFSGTLMLCGNGTGMYNRTFSSFSTQLFSIAFCLLILVCILLNFSGRRTFYALALALTGSGMIIYSASAGGGLFLYYSGVAIVFAAVWLNASLLYFISKIKNCLNHIIQPVTKKAIGVL